MKKLFFASALAAASFCHAQDPIFSQTYSAPMLLNPALAGSTGAGRFTNVQKQIGDFEQGYKNLYIGYDQLVNKIKSGVGLYFAGENIGDGNQILKRFGLNYSLPFSLSKEKKLKLAPAIELAFQESKIDISKYANKDSVLEKISSIDIGTGLLMNSDRLNLGIVAKHLNQPNLSNIRNITSKLPMRFSLIADYVFGQIEEKKKWKFAPGIRYDYTEITNNIAVTLAASYHKFKFGFGYRYLDENNSSAIAQVSYNGLLFKFRYCYDFYTGKVTGSNSGSHEVSTAINIFVKKKKDDFIANPMFAF